METVQSPIDAYRVELDYYSGPLDLLLYLVRRHEIDLHDIPIAKLTDQYLAHLETIQQIDIDLAGDFLVMAATLLEVKSRMIAPEIEADDDAEDTEDPMAGLDPRYELVQQLLEYKRFKDAAMELDDRRQLWEQRWPSVPGKLPKDRAAAADDDEEAEDAQTLELDLEDVNINDLCEAFARIMASVGHGPVRHEVVLDDTPITLHAEDIVDRLTRDGAMSLQQLFVGRTTRSEMIGLFLATLELVKLKKIRVLQDKVAGDISLTLRPEQEQLQGDDDEATDWRDPETGQMQYDWPSEEAQAAAERRATRRASRLRDRKFGDAEEDDSDDIVDLDDEADGDFDGAGLSDDASGDVDEDTPR